MQIMNKGKPLVLIVDDDIKSVKLIDSIISPNNYEVLKAYNGKDALNILEENPNIDLILLDVMMPDIDGFEVCSSIKKNKTYKGIPIILLTALTDDESQVRAFEVGAVDFICKPLNEEVVNARIKTHLTLSILLLEKEKLIWALSKALKKVSTFWMITAGLFIMLVLVITWAISGANILNL